MSTDVLAFVYNFPHDKSALGLLQLAASGLRVTCIASPWKRLGVGSSYRRVVPVSDELPHPRDVAGRLGFRYIVADHDAPDVFGLAKESGRGVVLGARVLGPHWTRSIQILNLHPGILPENRGLDNLKWAIYLGIPQAVTAHIIDEKIDAGKYLIHSPIDVRLDDTLVDVHIRLLRRQLAMLPWVLKMPWEKAKVLPPGVYRGCVSPEIDEKIPELFESYKLKYQEILCKPLSFA